MRTFYVYLFMLILSYNPFFHDRVVGFFKDTEAYELAIAIEENDLFEIASLVKSNKELLNVTNPVWGDNVLCLALWLEQYEAFKLLLELGADPNFINPRTKRSVLIEACKFYEKPKQFTLNPKYIELLLQYGANPNYIVEKDIIDSEGISHMACSPLTEASRLDLSYVKLLLKAGADPYQSIDNYPATPFVAALEGYKNKVKIISFYLDTLNIDVLEYVYVYHGDTLYIQDYIHDEIMDDYLKALVKNDSAKIKSLKEQTPDIEEDNKEELELIRKLEKRGVDFKNYKYKR